MKQQSFGQKLRCIRHEKGLSLKQAAKLIGIDYTTLSKIEKEERYPQITSVKAYADAYEVDYKELQIHYLTERILKQLDGIDYAVESLENAKRDLNRKNDKGIHLNKR
jgi:transcriptional regulator with XRE-family HTH domain